jgi:hypothetical protein
VRLGTACATRHTTSTFWAGAGPGFARTGAVGGWRGGDGGCALCLCAQSERCMYVSRMEEYENDAAKWGTNLDLHVTTAGQVEGSQCGSWRVLDHLVPCGTITPVHLLGFEHHFIMTSCPV